jgi:Reverse gyrase
MFITPTKALVQQTKEKFLNFASMANMNVDIITSNDKDRKKLKEKLLNKNFSIAIITPAFMSKNYELFTSSQLLGAIDVIFVDDVDALLKRSKSIDYILHLIGFDKEIIFNVKAYIGRLHRRDFDLSERQKIIKLIEDYKRKNKVGQLIFSSATTRVTSSRVKLLKLLLNFEPGSTSEVFRKIYDIKVETKNIFQTTVDIVNSLRSGGIIFVSSEEELINIEKLKKTLNDIGINAALVTGKDYSGINAFKRGEADVLIGHARFYGPLVRGIDIPEKVKYAIFYGVPKFVLDFKRIEKHPLRALWMAGVLLNLISDQNKRNALLKATNRLRLEVQKYSPEQLRFLTRFSEKNENMRLFRYTKELFETIEQILSEEEMVNALKNRFNIPVVEKAGKKYLVFSDSLTYLQGSGRTSRMYFAGITTGLSFLIIDDYSAFDSLTKQLKNTIEGFEWMDYKEFEKKKEEIMKIINKEREAISKKEAIAFGRDIQSLKTALFVVESPTKARSIASFFGRPAIRYINGIPVYECVSDKYIFNVIATKGHLLDLISAHDPQTNLYFGVKLIKENGVYPIYNTIKKCLNCSEQFTEYSKGEGICIYCGSNKVSDSKTTINVLKQLAKENDMVIIATDPDTEGEKIAYDVFLVVSPFAKEIKRAELHEITFKAFNDALKNLRTVNKNFVSAQIVRRVGDRWVGYTVSNVLQEKYGIKTLGIGRVQAPTLGWIIDNYNKHKRGRKRYFILTLENENQRLQVNSKTVRIKKGDRKTARAIKKALIGKEIEIEKVSIVKGRLYPPKPFTTSEMLMEGVNKLKMTSEKIMRLAQDLFEAGLITYHRTDSYYISNVGLQIAYNYLKDNNMADLYEKKQYASPGTHECIRPTKPLDKYQLENAIASGSIRIPIQLRQEHYMLYDLIFRNFIASQMRPARVKRIKISFKDIKIKIEDKEFNLQLNKIANVIVECDENSFAKVLPVNVFRKLLDLKEGRKFKIVDVQVRKKVTMLLTEDSLIKLMKIKGIGRPSTYSITIQKLKDHRYIFTSPLRKMLLPTKMAIRIYTYLKGQYNWIVDVELTRKFERIMDEIEQGLKTDIDSILKEFWEEYYVKVLDRATTFREEASTKIVVD